MSPSDSPDITRLLARFSDGDQVAMDRLLPLIYEELRLIARRRLAREYGAHTLSTTELVHEAYFKLVDQTRAQWRDRAHFFAVAATVMRRVLIDYARARSADKRGGGMPHVALEEAGELGTGRAEELVALDEALERLAKLNPRLARIVECRYFVGLTIEETAEALDVSPSTVKQDWRFAKAWLYRELQHDPHD